MKDIFDDVLERISDIKETMKLSDQEVKILSTPCQVHRAEIEYRGEKISTWRVLYNGALGPGKGGIRFHPDVSEAEVKSLAFWMTLKNSLLGLPFGGGKGGAKFNPRGRSKDDLQAISRLYIKKHYKHLGQDIDIPAPDVYTTPQIMGWMLDEFEKIVGHHEPGMITGKPIELGGCKIRGDSTAQGGYIIFKELIQHDGLPEHPTIAVQGFGNAGMNIAKILHAEGNRIIAVSDSGGGICDQTGLDINKVIEAKQAGKTVAAAKGEKISNAELLEIDADILILAALENQITKKNADKIRAKYIIELANGPVNLAADKILRSKKIVVVPDILANAGGVVVSYLEWTQNRNGNIFNDDYLLEKFHNMMENAWHTVWEFYRDRDDIDLRTSAYIIAIDRVLRAERFRGNL